MLTEDEAKTKWCPFARTPNYGREIGSTNRNMLGDGLETSRCIGSACMAWRWTTKVFFGVSWPGGSDGAQIGRRAVPFGSTNVGERHTVTAFLQDGEKPVAGYCGLAGKA